jgi:hypothetical protein
VLIRLVARRKEEPVMALDLGSLAPKCLAEWSIYICNLDIEKQARTIYQLLNLTPSINNRALRGKTSPQPYRSRL